MTYNQIGVMLYAIDNASKTLMGVANKIKGMGGAANAAVQELTGFSLSSFGVVGAVGAVGKVLGDSIKLTKNYAEQVRTMSAATGMSTEETSKMIQLFDDANVDIGLFTAASRKMVQQGLQPSIESMANLSDKFLSIKDPVERSKLLIDNFGRSGLAMGKLMQMGGEAIQEAGRQAELFGQVLDDEAIAEAENLRLAMDDLSDASEGLKLRIGKGLIPVLGDMAVALGGGITKTQDTVAVLTDLERAFNNDIITYEKERAIYDKFLESGRNYNAIKQDMIGIEAALRDDRRESIELMDKQYHSTEDIAEADANAALAAAELAGSYKDVIGAVKDASAPLALTKDILDKLAIAAGTATQEDLNLRDAIDYATKAAIAGKIPLSAYYAIMGDVASGASDATQALKDTKAAMDAIKSKTVTFTVRLKQTGVIPAGLPGSGPIVIPPAGGLRQFGGPVVGGRSYIVGEAGPELFVPGTSGKIVSNKNMPDGGITIGEINVYASDSMDEQSLAQLVIARLAAATRNSGYAGLDYAG